MHKVENYKRNIKKLNENSQDNFEKVIKPFLENDFKTNKIEESEYFELLEYAKNEYNKEYGFAKQQQEFRKKYDIDPIIMYHGKPGVVAPKRKCEDKEER